MAERGASRGPPGRWLCPLPLLQCWRRRAASRCPQPGEAGRVALVTGRGNQRLGPLAGGRLPVYFFHLRSVCHSQDFSEKGWNRKAVLGSLD